MLKCVDHLLKLTGVFWNSEWSTYTSFTVHTNFKMVNNVHLLTREVTKVLSYILKVHLYQQPNHASNSSFESSSPRMQMTILPTFRFPSMYLWASANSSRGNSESITVLKVPVAKPPNACSEKAFTSADLYCNIPKLV